MKTISMTTQELTSQAYMGDKIFINGIRKSYFQLRNMKGKSYTVSVEHENAINILRTTNVQTIAKAK